MRRSLILMLAALTLPFAAEAQSYRCTGKDGKRYYGATIPPECVGQTVEQLSSQGVVVRRMEAPMSAEERAKRDAEAKAAAEKDALAKEETRRNRALLATYQSEKDIEDARKRALADNEKAIKEAEGRVEGIRKRHESLLKEMDFYKGKNKPPAKLDEDIRNNQIDLKAQEELLAAKRKDVDGINARYDEDRRRFREISGLQIDERSKALGAEKGVTVTNKAAPSPAADARNRQEAERRAAKERMELEKIEREREAARRRSGGR